MTICYLCILIHNDQGFLQIPFAVYTIVCHILEGVDSLHCLKLTEVGLPRKIECLPLNWFQCLYVGYIRWHFNGRVKSSWSSPLLCGTCFMRLAKNFMVYALLVPGRMALTTILCCVAFIFVMSLFGRHYPVLSGLMPSNLNVRRQGFGSHILVTQDPLCDLSLVG